MVVDVHVELEQDLEVDVDAEQEVDGKGRRACLSQCHRATAVHYNS